MIQGDRSFRRGLQLSKSLVAAACVALLAGCPQGGSSTPGGAASGPPQVPTAPGAPQAPRPASPPQPAARQSAARGGTTTAAQRGSNEFLLGEAAPNFIVAPADLPFGQDYYAMSLPLDRQGSMAFSVVPPPAAPPEGKIAFGFRLPEGFTTIEAAGYSREGHPMRILCDADGSEMAYVAAGVFTQGVDGRAAAAGPAHAVYLDAYYVDLHEVTLRQYARFLESEDAAKAVAADNAGGRDDLPAAGVSWRDAVSYLKWAKKELPTEAEWEKAGRSDQSWTYPWGNDRAVWGASRKPGQVDPVNTFRNDRSRYGVMDLSGNLREWCQDWYSASYYGEIRTPDGSPVRNPTGPQKAGEPNSRVVKGGSQGWELWHRASMSMSKSPPDIGFRGVLRLSAPGSTSPAGPRPPGF